MKEIAVFGAGCFWGVEERFRTLPGVLSTEVGYAGGNLLNPTYKDVCSGETNHAEVIKIEFDKTLIQYEDLLDIFWSSHNPTTLNRQGLDIGSQYRSAIFFTTPEQEEISKNKKQELVISKRFSQPIVTVIEELSNYFAAEEYHQKYLYKRGAKTCGL